MSTEAQRAPHPPRPATPPPPPYPPATGTAETEAVSDAPRERTSGDTGAFLLREPGDVADGARGGAASSDGGRTSAAGSSGRTRSPRFPNLGATLPPGTDPMAPPPPRASARFPDTPPVVGHGPRPPATPSVPPQPTHRPGPPGTGAGTSTETTARLRPLPTERSAPPAEHTAPGTPADGPAAPGTRPPRDTPPTPPVPAAQVRVGGDPGHRSATAGVPPLPDPAHSWSAPGTPGGAPMAGAAPEAYDRPARTRSFAGRGRGQLVAAGACLVLGVGLIGGAVTGSWLAGDSGGDGQRSAFTAAGSMWHSVPVDQLFPPTLLGEGAGPGDADRTWTRIAVAPDSGCNKGAFDPLLRKVLAPVGCARLLRATYTDATQSHVTTVGLLFTEADAAGMEALARRFDRERLDRRSDLMPLPYAAKDTAAEGFGPEQRASWAISVLTDAPVVVYAVSGWADGRGVDTPQPAEKAMESGATTAPAQAGLGHEAQGLADRVERGLRKNIGGTDRERPS